MNVFHSRSRLFCPTIRFIKVVAVLIHVKTFCFYLIQVEQRVIPKVLCLVITIWSPQLPSQGEPVANIFSMQFTYEIGLCYRIFTFEDSLLNTGT